MDKYANIGNYRQDADFCIPVFEGVDWVPLNTLGKTRYTNAQMKEIAVLPLPERKSRIATLYEAVQFFILSGFRGAFDNEDVFIGDTLWQKHKSPEQAAASSEGCCATDTNWLAFYLRGRYPEMGSFCYANRDGNGHITTYIRTGGFYYFIDMMMCRLDSQAFFSPESGNLRDLARSEWAGYLYRAENAVDFCRFAMDRFAAMGRDRPFCFYLRRRPDVTATGLRLSEDAAVFHVPTCDHPSILLLAKESEGGGKGAGSIEFVGLPEELR